MPSCPSSLPPPLPSDLAKSPAIPTTPRRPLSPPTPPPKSRQDSATQTHSASLISLPRSRSPSPSPPPHLLLASSIPLPASPPPWSGSLHAPFPLPLPSHTLLAGRCTPNRLYAAPDVSVWRLHNHAYQRVIQFDLDDDESKSEDETESEGASWETDSGMGLSDMFPLSRQPGASNDQGEDEDKNGGEEDYPLLSPCAPLFSGNDDDNVPASRRRRAPSEPYAESQQEWRRPKKQRKQMSFREKLSTKKDKLQCIFTGAKIGVRMLRFKGCISYKGEKDWRRQWFS